MENLGVKFVRFSEAEVKYDIINVLRGIEGVIFDIIKNDPGIKLPKDFNMDWLKD